MDPLRASGAALAVGLAVAHSALGERYILTRLFRRPLPPLFGGDAFTRRTLRFAWHLTSVLWLGTAATLLLVADPAVLRIVAVTMLACAGVTLVGSHGKHPAWPFMSAVAWVSWAAAG